MDHWYWQGGFSVACWGTLALKILTSTILDIRKMLKEAEKK